MLNSSTRRGVAVAVFLIQFLVVAAMARMEAPAASNAVSSGAAVVQAKTAKTKKPAATDCSKQDDATLASRVKAALNKNASLKRLAITVEAKDGEVKVSGKGAKRGHVALATRTAKSVTCVKNVIITFFCAEGFKSCPNGECVCDECTCPQPKPPKPPKK